VRTAAVLSCCLAALLLTATTACESDEPPTSQAGEGEAGSSATPSPDSAGLESPPVIGSSLNSFAHAGSRAQLRLDLNELIVTDDELATVSFSITVESSLNGDGKPTDHLAVGDTFGERTGERSVGGAYLVDPAKKKKYLVYRDTNGTCICSESLGQFPVGEPVSLFASFPAPPSTTKSMTVVVPNFPPFEDVPVTRA
jgi:hypothetical protein